MLLVLMLVALQAGPSLSTVEAREAYRSCVLGAAVRLERSRETADLVAQAALEQCHGERNKFVTEAGGDDDRRFARVLISRIEADVLRDATARVVSIRAARH